MSQEITTRVKRLSIKNRSKRKYLLISELIATVISLIITISYLFVPASIASVVISILLLLYILGCAFVLIVK